MGWSSGMLGLGILSVETVLILAFGPYESVISVNATACNVGQAQVSRA